MEFFGAALAILVIYLVIRGAWWIIKRVLVVLFGIGRMDEVREVTDAKKWGDRKLF